MSYPMPVTMTQDTVVLLASEINSITIKRHYSKGRDFSYMMSFVPAGEPAPTLSEAKLNASYLFRDEKNPEYDEIVNENKIDVYGFCNNGGRAGTTGTVIVWEDTGSPLRSERVVDFYFIKPKGNFTTLSAKVSAPGVDTDITITNPTGYAIGDDIGISSGGTGGYYFGIVLNVVGNVVSLDTPVDVEFPAGANVFNATREMSVDGSTTTQIFEIRGPATTGLSIYITRVLMTCLASSQVDLSLFGNIPALAKGIVMRKKFANGTYENIFNCKSNAELKGMALDWEPLSATNPNQGQDGFGWRFTFADESKHASGIQLGPDDSLELLIQDGLLPIDSLTIIGEGSFVS